MVYITNNDNYSDIETQCVAFYALNNKTTYFCSFGVEHIQKESKKIFQGSSINKSTISTNIYRIQAHDSVKFGYFCIGLIDFMPKGKSLTELNLSSPNTF